MATTASTGSKLIPFENIIIIYRPASHQCSVLVNEVSVKLLKHDLKVCDEAIRILCAFKESGHGSEVVQTFCMQQMKAKPQLWQRRPRIRDNHKNYYQAVLSSWSLVIEEHNSYKQKECNVHGMVKQGG